MIAQRDEFYHAWALFWAVLLGREGGLRLARQQRGEQYGRRLEKSTPVPISRSHSLRPPASSL